MFTLRQILDKFREYNLQTHHLFIDFKASYDSVKRKELWKIMLEHGFPAKLIRLIRATLDGAISSVRIANETSEAFVTLDGLKQGDALSNLLFIIALEGAARRAGVQRNGTLITKSHMLLGYADDIDIIGIDRRSARAGEVCLKEEQVLDWPGRQTNSRFYLSGGKDKKLGTGFIVRGKMQDRVFGFTAISERMCKLRIRGRFFNYSIINVHCPHEEKTDD
ncbi:uncharacterized protein LOC120429290 [Culex pipiens pallens]|uniref:uncharacterized protein LOC120429290 n=1 Tax=Culex pipiens pallens TaxID=42434 RepID=UPI0022AA3A0B|nr:uncharacterized protein LOC120429290 [Culex pipiens pallens]